MPAYCPYTCARIVSALEFRKYKVFRGEYDLNIVGVRSRDLQANTFNDWITMFHLRASGIWAFYAFQATTDPGTYWRQNPENTSGTGILATGQHRGLWRLGQHRGVYQAFTQAAPVKVWRDNDRNAVLDVGRQSETGMFGINMHRAKEEGASANVDKWSAACQVFADSDDFAFALTLARRQIAAQKGDTFTYTLLDENDVS